MQGVHFQCLEVSPNVLGPGIWNRKETKWPHYRKFESVFISWGIEINAISFTEMIHRNYSLIRDTGVTADLDPAALYTADFIPLPPLADINPKIILGSVSFKPAKQAQFLCVFRAKRRCESCTRGKNAIKMFFFFALLLLRYLLFVLAARFSPIACKTHKIYGCLQVILHWGGSTTCDKSGGLKW